MHDMGSLCDCGPVFYQSPAQGVGSWCGFQLEGNSCLQAHERLDVESWGGKHLAARTL